MAETRHLYWLHPVRADRRDRVLAVLCRHRQTHALQTLARAGGKAEGSDEELGGIKAVS